MKLPLIAFLFICFTSYAQEDLTTLPGKLYHDSRPEANRPKVKAVFQLIEKVPFISQPKGMNIQEKYVLYNTNGNNGEIRFQMLEFYRNNEIIEANTDEPPSINIDLNKPDDLMDATTIFYDGKWKQVGLPVMFTDTFTIKYSKINGYAVGQADDKRFKIRKYIINPKQSALFRPVTQEEYLSFFVEKLREQIKEDAEMQLEAKAQIETLKTNPSLKSTLNEVMQINDAMVRYTAFMKTKLSAYEKKLINLAAAEKKAPAYWYGHKDPAVPMKDGKPVLEIKGHLDHEPADKDEDLIFKIPVFTFSEIFFDPKLPKDAISLFVFWKPFPETSTSPLKKRVETELFPLIPYKELAALMYK